MAVDYEVNIDHFQGPLDLLYQLIKDKEIPISRISLAAITDQYFSYMEQLKDFDLDQASEFMDIATELLQLKARLLLPENQEDKTEEEEDDLVKRLKEYQLFKNISQYLLEREEKAKLYKQVYLEIDKRTKSQFELNVNIQELKEIYIKAFKEDEKEESFSPENFVSLEESKYRVEDKSQDIINNLNKKGKEDFINLIEDPDNNLEIVVTLLSILELNRLKKVKVTQEELFQNIVLEKY